MTIKNDEIITKRGGNRTAAIATRYPVAEGLQGWTWFDTPDVDTEWGSEKQTGRQMNLVPQGLLGVRSVVPRKDKVGF